MSNEDLLTNFTFDELTIGQSATFTKACTEETIKTFAIASGDNNPVHLDEEFASQTQFGGRIAHGLWTGSLISAAVATRLPGPGSIYLGQSLKFRRPVKIGDELTVTLTIESKKEKNHSVEISCDVKNQTGKSVVTGTADIMAPTEKVSVPNITLPSVSFDD